MTTTINASTTAGLVQTADTSGVLALQTAGTTAVSISASQVVTLTNALAEASGGTGTTTGYYGFKNRIINGAMVIDQRNAGASITTNAYVTDRWLAEQTTDGVRTAQQVSDAPTGFVKSLKLTTTTADASLAATQYSIVRQGIEGYNTADLMWGTANAQAIIISFWVKSSLTGTFGGVAGNSAFNRSYPFTYSISSANTWEQKTVTISGDTSGTWETTNSAGIQLYFGLGVGSTYSGTAGAWTGSGLISATGAVNVMGTLNATWQITGVQLEKGSTATSFDYRPYTTELQLCQRYCMAWRIDGTAQQYLAVGQAYATSVAIYTLPLPVTPRVTPTGITTSAASGFGSLTTTAGGSVGSALTINSPSNMALTILYTATAGFTTAGSATALYFNGTAGAYIYTTGSEL
jgi:hypothetical protein